MVPITAHDARERAIADSQFGGGVTSWAPATWYLGLSSTTPNDDGTSFTEPTGIGAYARVAITNNVTNWPAASTASGVTSKINGTTFTFTNPTGTWGSMTYWGLFTTLTGGTPEYSNPLDSGITVKNGNTPVQIEAGQLILTWA